MRLFLSALVIVASASFVEAQIISGQLSYSPKNVGNDGQVVPAGQYSLDSVGGAFTLLLQYNSGHCWIFADQGNAGSNAISIGAVSDTFNGVAGPLVINQNRQVVQIVADGANEYNSYSVTTGGNTIYTADDTLLGNRTIAGGGNSLAISGVSTLTATATGAISTTSNTGDISLNAIGADGDVILGTFATGALAIPTGADPDTDVTTPQDGMIKYDSTDHEFRAFVNGTWQNLTAAGGANIYTTNSTLTGARTLNGGGNLLTLTNITAFDVSAATVGIIASGDLTLTSTGVDGDIIAASAASGALVLPVDSDPDTNVTTPQNGMIKYDSTDHEIRGYVNGSWVNVGDGGVTIYSGDSTLAGNRTIAGGSNSLTINGLSSFSVATTGAASVTSSAGDISLNAIGSDGDVVLGTLATGALAIPAGADPDTDVTTPQNGMIKYDSTDHQFRAFVDGSWVELSVLVPPADVYVSVSAASDAITAGAYLNVLGNATISDRGVTSSAWTIDDVNDRLVYTGAKDQLVHVSIVFSMTTSNNNVTSSFRLAKNGIADGTTQIDRKIGTGSDVGSASIQGYYMMSTNDYIEVHGTLDASSSDTITLTRCSINIE